MSEHKQGAPFNPAAVGTVRITIPSDRLPSVRPVCEHFAQVWRGPAPHDTFTFTIFDGNSGHSELLVTAMNDNIRIAFAILAAITGDEWNITPEAK